MEEERDKAHVVYLSIFLLEGVNLFWYRQKRVKTPDDPVRTILSGKLSYTCLYVVET